jgi:hypothetical protein
LPIFLSYEDLRARGDAPWSRDHLRRKVKAGEFPPPVVLSRKSNGRPNRIAWPADEIEARRERLIAERDATAEVAAE